VALANIAAAPPYSLAPKDATDDVLWYPSDCIWSMSLYKTALRVSRNLIPKPGD
jgi:hypothetical protein